MLFRSGVIAGAVQVLTNPFSHVPTIGASGAIAAVMGAYLVKFPKARIITLVPLFVFMTTMEIPAVLLLLYWFVIQLFSSLTGVGALESRYGDGGVAWFAHVGGFVAGMLLIRRFPERRRPRVWWAEE